MQRPVSYMPDWLVNADLCYIVLPMRPAGTGGLSEQQLADIVTRDCLVGTALPRVPTA
jgi:nitrile hydratase subunit alpha